MQPIIMLALLGGVLILMVVGFYWWLTASEQTDPWANNDPWKDVDPYQESEWPEADSSDWNDIEAQTKASKQKRRWRPQKSKGQDLIKEAIRAPDTREGDILDHQSPSDDAEFTEPVSRQRPKHQLGVLAPLKRIMPSKRESSYPATTQSKGDKKQSPSHSATVKQRIIDEVYEENRYPESRPTHDDERPSRNTQSKKQRRGYRHSREFSLTLKFVSKKK